MAFEQLESVWPVHGSVLVRDGTVYCVAGRSMFTDGGMRLYRLDPLTGRKLSETVLDDRNPETGANSQAQVKGLNMPAALPDILSSNDRYVYMRTQRFDFAGERLAVGPTDVANQSRDGAASVQRHRLSRRLVVPPRPLHVRQKHRLGRQRLVPGRPRHAGGAAAGGRRGRRLRFRTPAGIFPLGDALDSPPVWDGLAAANGRLYLATANGAVLCFGRL